MENRIVNNQLEFDYLDPGEIQDLQGNLLAKLYRHARSHPAVSYRFMTADELTSGKNIIEIWKSIPAIESESHQVHTCSNEIDFRELSVAGNASIVFSTSGSGGKPKYIWLAFDEMMRNTRYHGKGYSMAGIGHKDRVATFGLPGYLESNFTAYHALSTTGCQIVPIGSVSDPGTVVKIIRDLNVNVLLAMPSNLLPIVGYLTSANERLDNIRLVVTGGEKLHESVKDSVRSCVGNSVLPFRSTYQTADTGTIGFQCASCSGDEYHLHEELQYLELIDIDGASHVAVTNLDRYLMPVIKVLTGDVGQWVNSQCPCGRRTKKIRLLGRAHSDIKIGGEKLQFSILQEWLTTFSLPLESTSITIDKNNIGQDMIGLKVQSDLMQDTAYIQEIIGWLYQKSNKLKSQVESGIVSPVVIEPLIEGDFKYSISGKRILVNDRRLS